MLVFPTLLSFAFTRPTFGTVQSLARPLMRDNAAAKAG
jgi:hypothetical protein